MLMKKQKVRCFEAAFSPLMSPSRKRSSTLRSLADYSVMDVQNSCSMAMNAIRQIVPMVENGRQWYAVYRALCDRKAVETDDFYGFAALVARIVPDHPHLPVGSELIRLATGSFRKPVALWDRNDAPVRGKRFEAYLRIARLMLAQL